MAETTKIAWTDATFNGWIGCAKVSEGCAHCYAESMMDHRYGKVVWGKGQPRKRTSAAYWREPLRWNQQCLAQGVRKRVFCASLADVFDAEAPQEWRDDLWDLIESTPWLDWLLLTKRPENIRSMLRAGQLNNVWLGTSVESPKVLWRIEHLLAVPAVIHFISAEPLLEDLAADPRFLDYLSPTPARPGLAWVIAGGESGNEARECHLGWLRRIVNACFAKQVPCFVKQLGLRPVNDSAPDLLGERRRFSVPLSHSKGGDPDEWPSDLRVREVPDPGLWTRAGATSASTR